MAISFRKENIHNVYPIWILSGEKDVWPLMQRNGDWEEEEGVEAMVEGCLGPKASVWKWL